MPLFKGSGARRAKRPPRFSDPHAAQDAFTLSLNIARAKAEESDGRDKEYAHATVRLGRLQSGKGIARLRSPYLPHTTEFEEDLGLVDERIAQLRSAMVYHNRAFGILRANRPALQDLLFRHEDGRDIPYSEALRALGDSIKSNQRVLDRAEALRSQVHRTFYGRWAARNVAKATKIQRDAVDAARREMNTEGG